MEEFFVSRRGDPLMLSNADWNLIRKWRMAGLPLRVVLRGITDALDSHAHSWSRDRKVGSLAYCAAEVEVAAERWRRALALGEEEGVSAESALRGFADALDGARDLGPRSAPLARDLAAEIRARADDAARRDLEPWLVEREASLRAALEEDMGRAAVEAVAAAVDRDLAPYRDRMPARVLDQVRRESLTRRVLEAHGLPRLSLFHL
ncbi:MAG TPA: hypothetical protein VGN09_00915 [Vicinamibacteria bacterium]